MCVRVCTLAENVCGLGYPALQDKREKVASRTDVGVTERDTGIPAQATSLPGGFVPGDIVRFSIESHHGGLRTVDVRAIRTVSV